MTDDNVALVEAFIAAVQREDWDTVLAAFDPEVELDQQRMPDGGIYRGPAGVREFYGRWFGSWDDLHVELQYARALPDGRVISLVHLRGRGRASGVEVTMIGADVWTLRDGKVVQLTGYPDHAEALEAVGLSD
jgi:ketosteroid isomerase-like protein